MCAITGGDFSLLGHIDVNGFPKEDPASNLHYNIPGDVLICTLGTATPPFVYSADPPLPDGQTLQRPKTLNPKPSSSCRLSTDVCGPVSTWTGLHLNEANGQLYGAPITSADAKLLQFRIMV